MADLGGFNANQVNPVHKTEPVPAGIYQAVIVKSAMVKTKAGDGRFLELWFDIIDGEHQSRSLAARLNLEHRSPEAVKHARAELSRICRAVGVMTPRDSEDLHNIPLTIEVAVEPWGDSGQPGNIIKSYSKSEATEEKPYGDIPV